jgi:2-dehydropantoate 2-reductase
VTGGPTTRHAILGVGGVGGFVGAVLGAAGQSVLLLLRPSTFAVHPPHLSLESPLGNLHVPAEPRLSLTEPVDLLWVAPKATQLAAALELVPDPSQVGAVVPLLNGVDHVARLREVFGDDAVLPGTIAAELERVAPGRIVHRSPFARFGFVARAEPVIRAAAGAFTRYGCPCTFEEDETTLLWRKLSLLAPLALVTTAAGKTVGEVREDPAWGPRLEAAVREAGAVATAEGARISTETNLGFLRSAPAGLRSSMQKDVAGGRPPEIEAIGGPILRAARRHGLSVPVTEALVHAIQGAA